MQPSEYKPLKPEDFIGKTRIIAETLCRKVELVKAEPQVIRWLFYGPPGVGKTALAECLALELAGNGFAIERVSGASLLVEIVRHWRDTMHYRPMFGRVGVKLINELDLASVPAQNEMLQFLDDLPDYQAVIATTNSELSVLQKRLQSRFAVRRFDAITIEEVHRWLVKSWGIPHQDAWGISQTAKGDVRQALNDAESYLESKEAA